MVPARLPWILWAEDDRNDQRLIREALREVGVADHVHFAGDGSAALALLAKSDPLPVRVVLDLRMGPMDGLPALRQMRADPALRHLDAVVFTAGQVDDEMAEALRLGARFIVKPSHFAAFAAAAQEAVAGALSLPAAGPGVPEQGIDAADAWLAPPPRIAAHPPRAHGADISRPAALRK